MKLNTKIKLSIIFTSLCFMSVSHAAWMEDFYNSAGAASNVTVPQAISSQSVVGYTGGGLVWRVPNKNFSPFQITPPSLKGGCGGIDLYLGSYSFPNKDAFIQALRNYGQAAIGYFFTLALKTMAPEIESALAYINKIAQDINGLTMNSCSAAKATVGFLGDAMFGMNSREASGSMRAKGTTTDEFSGMKAIQDGNYMTVLNEIYDSTFGKSKSALTAADAGKAIPAEVNIVHFALKNQNIDITEDEEQLIMSLVGPSLIIRSAKDSDGQDAPINTGEGPSIEFKEIVGLSANPEDNVQLTVYECDREADCLQPTRQNVSVAPFTKIVESVIKKVRDGVSGRTAQSFSSMDKVVLKLSSVPIYRAAAMSVTPGVAGAVSTQLLEDLRDYAALDAATRFVNHYITIMEKALAGAGKKLPEGMAPSLVRIETRIATLRRDMFLETQSYYAQKGNPFAKIDQLEKAEKYMFGNLNAMLAANARFGKT